MTPRATAGGNQVTYQYSLDGETWGSIEAVKHTDVTPETITVYVKASAEGYTDKVEHGIFGADMKVSLVNDGPFTLTLDSEELLGK